MPKRKAAVKRLRVDKKRHAKNVRIKRELKTAIKKFLSLFSSKQIEEAKKTLGRVYSLLDKAAKKNIIHPNTASRKKARFARKISKAA
ncbi:MAG: 30S ribosomal protein S20 [Candidatus Omnitrophica bacterium]|nr:30S ribosomal protein S20 [Candidatus Omnitrophota bacterium]